MKGRFRFADTRYFLVANVLVLGTVAYAFVLDAHYADLYYLTVQEDEYLEWSTFWAFVLAAVASLRAALVYRHSTQMFPWYLCGVALFCFVVAMEEISWGQRLFGYRPPAYFLEHNFQQEFNFHNVVDTDYRKLALMLVIVGYGVVLPLASQVSVMRRWFARVGIVAPAISLLPAFTGTFLVYFLYPWSHSGEWVELMLGLCFLFSAAAMPLGYGHEKQSVRSAPPRSVKITAIAYVAVVGLGLTSGAISRAQRDAHPEMLQAARIEVEAVAHDFESGLATTRCNLHKRLYTFVQEYEQSGLREGSFAGLRSQGLPQERAEFFLDPWNSPYWIRDRCDRQNNSRAIFVYSFGPNRRRDSTRTEILGDDIGFHISGQ